jgi:hypothetical protein
VYYSDKEAAKRGETNTNVNLGDYCAYNSRFSDAARNYQQAGAPERAMAMFSDLRMFDQAKVNFNWHANNIVDSYMIDYERSI